MVNAEELSSLDLTLKTDIMFDVEGGNSYMSLKSRLYMEILSC